MSSQMVPVMSLALRLLCECAVELLSIYYLTTEHLNRIDINLSK